MDRIEAMQIFVQVVEKGSFTAAAEHLQLHRPVATRAIQHLEQTLGVRLLNRTTRKLNVTDEGEDFYQRAVQLLAGIEDTFASYPDAATMAKGRLKVSLAATVANAIVIPALPDFQRRYPQIEIHLGVSDQPVDIFEDNIDCVVRLGPLDDSSAVAKRVGHMALVTCTSRQYVDQHGLPESIEQLRSHHAINFVSGRNRRLVDWTFNDGKEELRLKLSSTIVTDNSDSLLACALAGMGIVQGVRAVLRPYLDSGRLVEVLPTLPPSPKAISVLYPHRVHLPAKTSAFVRWLEEIVPHV
ncbi:LysR family transcriptional regulator [Pokkaliibacter sp. MBI-7]|uniref:LysR family transcriptional regulator n=1 Tax=Pokkaliibacter sp. MBI-7 TaxID=3040600 RepID=UPI00244CCDF0|nr:LysR family transcriptional regulator [Pokkaliibacter sp. MBI-7]MDH2433680.1 LysR family transcriptional regulator [Pokkaliibacter sp. MBI-7]